MKKKLFALSLILMSMFIAVGCGSSNADSSKNSDQEATNKEKVTINIGLPKAPPAFPVYHMIETNAMGDNVEINIDQWDSPEQLIAMTQDNKHNMFALPLTVGAKLYNKGVKINLTNVNTWGVNYFVTSDKNIKNWSDLKGKTIHVPLKSSPPDIVLRYFLNKNGVNPDKDVKLEYATTSEVAQLIKAGKAEYAVMLEPQVTNVLKGNDKLRVAFSYDEEWKKIMGSDKDIPNAGLGATTEFINANPEVIKKFEEEYEKALNYLVKNPDKLGEIGEKHFNINKEVMKASVPTLGIMYKDGKESIKDLNDYYKVLYDFDPETIGGKIPGEDFYYGTK